MKLWKYSVSNNYATVVFVEFLERDLAKHFRGEPIRKWENVWVTLGDGFEDGKPL